PGSGFDDGLGGVGGAGTGVWPNVGPAAVRPKTRTVAWPRRRRLRYQNSILRMTRAGPGRSIRRLQEPWRNSTRVLGDQVSPFPNVSRMLYISRLPPST